MPEASLRLGVFLSLLILMSAAEALWPRRARLYSRLRRWSTHAGIVVLGSAVVRALAALGVPLLAVAVAGWAQAAGVGLMNLVAGPAWLEFVATIVVLDLLLWAQHLVSHRVPLFWRLHRVHHADRDFDASTALRFHPLEIAASMLVKCVAVLLLGAAPAAVIAFEILLNGMAMFNHANLRLPAGLDAALRRLVVTPDMHRVHHSVLAAEHQSNFGFNLSAWDRLFGTYKAQPEAGHEAMTIGLGEFQSAQPTRLWWSLALPARRP